MSKTALATFVGLASQFNSAAAIKAEVSVSIFPGAGLPASSYSGLTNTLKETLGATSEGEERELCVAHSPDGVEAALNAAAGIESKRCSAGLVALAAAPLPEQLEKVAKPVLVIAGDMDGIVRFSHFAVARHRSLGVPMRRFAAMRGASHTSFASGSAIGADLQPLLSVDDTHKAVSNLVQSFLSADSNTALTDAEQVAFELSKPITDALVQEGSAALGHPWCNSDYPTNPSCQYPKFPDHSTPFGPAPAPNPLPPTDCVCGSPWVAGVASKLVAGLPDSIGIETKDAFHDVADTHPFHLPHIFNKCEAGGASCVLNATTLTMPFVQPGALWAEDKPSAQPLSALELRAKIKSREATYEAAGIPNADKKLDKNFTMCADINQAALKWALDNADAAVKKRYESSGEPLVIVDDKVATIGLMGPEWIKDELVFARVVDKSSPSGMRVEVQSWMFVVGNTNGGNVPWFFPVGMHYCKLLSPARAMEWIYTDAHRRHAPVTDAAVIV